MSGLELPPFRFRRSAVNVPAPLGCTLSYTETME